VLPTVAEFGRKNLRSLGYGPERLKLKVGDGYAGWPDAAPFDVIVVTAAPERVPVAGGYFTDRGTSAPGGNRKIRGLYFCAENLSTGPHRR